MKLNRLLAYCATLVVSSAFPVSPPYKGLTRSFEVPVLSINDTLFVDIQFGSAKDAVLCIVDTGSSDLWVTQACAKGVYSNTTECPSYGFDPTSSFTFRNNYTHFGTQYADQSGVLGYFGTDTVQLAGLSVNDMSFGVINDSMSDFPGLLGLGMVALETTNHYAEPFTYENLPVKLKTSGLIERNLFSLSIGQGSLLFGAIDPSKFSGPLQTLPLQSENSYVVNVNGMSVRNTTASGFPQKALLDSGDETLELPNSTLAWLMESYGVEYNQDYEGYTTTCGSQFDDLKFSFGHKTITIPSGNLLVDTQTVDEMGDSVCIFAVIEGAPDLVVLGKPFMSSAYVVFDLDEKAIHLAQVRDAEGSSQTGIQQTYTAIQTSFSQSSASVTDKDQGGTSSASHTMGTASLETTMSTNLPEVTYPSDTVTLPTEVATGGTRAPVDGEPSPKTVTLPAEIITLPAETITQPAETITSTQVVVLTVTSTYTAYGNC